MPETQQEVPEWVMRMRAAGYNVRIGTLDEPLSEIPEAMFPPPIPKWRRFFGGILIRGIRNTLFRGDTSTRNGRYAHLP